MEITPGEICAGVNKLGKKNFSAILLIKKNNRIAALP